MLHASSHSIVSKVCTLQAGAQGSNAGNGFLFFYFIFTKFIIEFEFEVAVVYKINKLHLFPFDLYFTCFRDTSDLTERLSTVTAALAVT